MYKMVLTRRALFSGAVGALTVAPGLGWPRLAAAQDTDRLRIGMATPPTTLDPHFQSNAPNNAIAMHLFDALVTNDENARPTPCLATSWRPLDDTHWEFVLRPGVTYSDGTPFTPADVIASVERVNSLQSPASYRTYTRTIKAITTPDPGRIIIETKAPDPLLPVAMGRIRIISAQHKDAPTANYNAGRAVIGTGPYLLKEFSQGSHLILTRNEGYWGPKPEWKEVLIRLIGDDGARTAGLLSGDLDVIEEVPFEAVERVAKDQRFHIIRGLSSRIVYFGFDHAREVTPFATDLDGKPLPRNPMKDLRVRQALSLAINRKAIVAQVMSGNAEVATQYLPKGAPGTSATLEPIPYDPERAKKLLAEAGYPNGFRLVIHGPNDRYINDAKVVQAVAQMLSRIGVQTKVEVMPWSVYSGKSNSNEFTLNLMSWGVNTGETSNPLIALNATYDKERGNGSSNGGRYSNPDLDKKLQVATQTMNDDTRNRLLAEASEMVFNDCAIMPLYHEVVQLAARKTVGYRTRNDQYTLAMGIRKI
ncbi:ABC transporter substrate-binding protein [Azospirillum griseum]|uniref:ABC transporter substrate-binding protein n=1 Tax=Azospirillum griseum TaxID=2496639 RepID=A0A3S0K0Y4_9PROT|nr:ABC transporter substrate-binding protein [Azospirillum griseum]RTR15752.1 ABC transporter substrate-binding protein [Azospirillum griseum]